MRHINIDEFLTPSREFLKPAKRTLATPTSSSKSKDTAKHSVIRNELKNFVGDDINKQIKETPITTNGKKSKREPESETKKPSNKRKRVSESEESSSSSDSGSSEDDSSESDSEESDSEFETKSKPKSKVQEKPKAKVAAPAPKKELGPSGKGKHDKNIIQSDIQATVTRMVVESNNAKSTIKKSKSEKSKRAAQSLLITRDQVCSAKNAKFWGGYRGLIPKIYESQIVDVMKETDPKFFEKREDKLRALIPPVLKLIQNNMAKWESFLGACKTLPLPLKARLDYVRNLDLEDDAITRNDLAEMLGELELGDLESSKSKGEYMADGFKKFDDLYLQEMVRDAPEKMKENKQRNAETAPEKSKSVSESSSVPKPAKKKTKTSKSSSTPVSSRPERAMDDHVDSDDDQDDFEDMNPFPKTDKKKK